MLNLIKLLKKRVVITVNTNHHNIACTFFSYLRHVWLCVFLWIISKDYAPQLGYIFLVMSFIYLTTVFYLTINFIAKNSLERDTAILTALEQIHGTTVLKNKVGSQVNKEPTQNDKEANM